MNEDLYQLQYTDPESLLVITPSGQIKKLLCPFPVVCIVEVARINKGDTVMVTSVATEKQELRDIIIFIINEHKIYYWFFRIT